MESRKLNIELITRKERGITLITLIITIVILIILSTVTINVVFGEGGLIEQAQLAKDMTEQATLEEQQSLNHLMEEMEKALGNDDEEITEPKINIIERNEDNIKIKVEGSNLKDYQFSLDGNNWSDIQSSPEYTFAGLEKVFFASDNMSDYNDIPTGNKYTVYAKAKDKSGKEIELQPVQTSNIIEITSGSEFWEYEDLGNEIMITGVKPVYELYDYFEFNNPRDIWNITKIELSIPSYINGKPVTKINFSLWLDMERKTTVDKIRIFVFNAENNIVKDEIIDVKDINDIIATYELHYGAYYICGLADTAMSSYNNTFIGDYNVELLLALNSKYNIIIPPTVKEIVLDEKIAKNENSYTLNGNRRATQNEIKLIAGNTGKINIIVNAEQLGENNYGTGRVRICGKNDFNELVNGDFLEKLNGDYIGVEFIK